MQDVDVWLDRMDRDREDARSALSLDEVLRDEEENSEDESTDG